jgi:hypothetical protein
MEYGVDRREWEAEMSGLEEDLETSPAEALPELDALVRRMLDETGIDDPEILTEYEAAHEIAESEAISLGDLAAAVKGLRTVYDAVLSRDAP